MSVKSEFFIKKIPVHAQGFLAGNGIQKSGQAALFNFSNSHSFHSEMRNAMKS